jgi:DNA-directed RNA polymerase sigma subunit (sigma70/sigma32)
MGVCKERIRQIQSRAMEKLRGMAAEAHLERTVGDWL